MGFGNQQDGSSGQPMPIHMGMLPGMHSVGPRPAQVSIADIYQVAVNQAVQDHQLDKLFNPEFYDDDQI